MHEEPEGLLCFFAARQRRNRGAFQSFDQPLVDLLIGGRHAVAAAAFLLLALATTGTVAGQDGESARGERRAHGERPLPALPAEVAALDRLSVVLGCPTDRSVTLSVLSADALEGYCEFGSAPEEYTHRTALTNFPVGQPVAVLLDQLPPDKTCSYRLQYRAPGEIRYTEGVPHVFHTQRAAGGTFVFEVQGDSHPERPQQFDPMLYQQTLKSAAADQPDFYLLMGDDFSVDTLQTINADAVARRYRYQRSFLSLIGQSAPIFLVNGNHEQAAVCNLDGTPCNVAVWAQTSRNRYFPQPAPDGFYIGDLTNVPFIGLLRDYYAWTWGDALFVVIDPYWHSSMPVDNVLGGGAKRDDMWSVTLGDAQYQWFRQTLERSRARYKFVFTHHVLGTGRGGIELAGGYEWGGRNRRGEWEFPQQRPGWTLPIHQLMATNRVTIFFQGHDHIFAHQQLDGVVYQTLAQPADPNYTRAKWADDYRSGDILPSSGRVRVLVTPAKVRVEYVRSYLPRDATTTHPDGEIAFSYEIPAQQTSK